MYNDERLEPVARMMFYIINFDWWGLPHQILNFVQNYPNIFKINYCSDLSFNGEGGGELNFFFGTEFFFFLI